MAATTVLKVARTPAGYCLRVEGRGTMKESRPAAEFVGQGLGETPAPTFAVDLSDCDYLDSTFLGCLVDMQRRVTRASAAPSPAGAGVAVGPRFAVWAPPDKVKKLLSPTKLDLVLKRAAGPPQVVGEFVELAAADPAEPDVMRHVMECHRRLAETGCPQQAAFAAIADNIERELRGKGQ